MIERYLIETKNNTSFVREKIDCLFNNSNNILKEKFIGSLTGDDFSGSTNYNVNIIVKGKILKKDSITTLVKVTIRDDSPNYSSIENAFLIIFFCISIIVIAANKSTDLMTYLIAIVIFGFTFFALKIKRKISSYLKPKLKQSANIIAKEIQGELKPFNNLAFETRSTK